MMAAGALMSLQTEEIRGGELLLRFEGSFEASDAWQARELLRGAGSTRPGVVLDFGQVRTFQDFAIALIAPDIAAAGDWHVHVRGLGLHQQRLLEYFGVGRRAQERPRFEVEEAIP
jgi:hypothetical protein